MEIHRLPERPTAFRRSNRNSFLQQMKNKNGTRISDDRFR